MIRPKTAAKSIVTKLIFKNGILLLAFAGIILVNFTLTRQTRQMFANFVDNGVARVIANGEVSRSINQLASDIEQMVTMFTLEQTVLDREAERLTGEMARIAGKIDDDPELKDHLNRFAASLALLIEDCTQVDNLLSRIDAAEQAFNDQLNGIEAVVRDNVVLSKIEGKEYKLDPLEQVGIAIPDLRYLMLKVNLTLVESQRAHLKRKQPESDFEDRILSMIRSMESFASTITTAGPELTPLGDGVSKIIQLIREQTVSLHRSMETLQENLESLRQSRAQVLDKILDSGRIFSSETTRMREGMVRSFRSYGVIMGMMALLVVAMTAAAGVYGVSIARRIQRLTRSASAIAAGDLDREIKPEGHDEVAILARNFLKMRAAIREKMNDMAAKNEALGMEIDLRKKTETALRQSEKKYRTLLENIPQKIFFKDRQSVFLSCNDNFSRDLGLSPEQIIGKSDYDLYPADLAEKYIADDWRIMETGIAENIEEPYLSGGENRIINTVKTPVRDPSGDIIGILGIFWDITEKKRIEKNLRKYEQIVATSKDMMAIVDPDFVYQAVNRAYATVYGIPRTGIVGRRMPELVGQDVFAQIMKHRLDNCLAGENITYKEWFLFPNAEKRYLDVAYTPYFESSGEVAGIVINARDATETKLLEEKLSQVQKMEAIGTLAGGIAHDFNNILGGIIGYCDLLLLEVPDQGEARQWVTNVLTGAHRAKNLVTQILAFSHRSEQKVEPVRLEPIIDETFALMRASTPATIEILKQIHPVKGGVMADPTQIHQVLVNLCTNASHAMRDSGGVLTVALEEVELPPGFRPAHPDLNPGTYFRIVVKDTGHGIAPENLDRIFEPYFTTKEKGVGTGLGLATVHGIIKNYNGLVEVTSTPGVGTKVSVFLPKVDMVDAPFLAQMQKLEPLNKCRILLVDDEDTLLDVGKTMLSHLGCHVKAINGAASAVDVFGENPQAFDLVITDQTMPNMTGQELAAQLKRIRADIPIILCTGFSSLIDEKKASTMGIEGYLRKPIGLQDLSVTLKKFGFHAG